MSARPVPPSTPSVPYTVYTSSPADILVEPELLAAAIAQHLAYIFDKIVGINTPDERLSADMSVDLIVDDETMLGFGIMDVTFTSLGHVRQVSLYRASSAVAEYFGDMAGGHVVIVEARFNDAAGCVELAARPMVYTVGYDEVDGGMEPVFCDLPCSVT